MEVENTLADDPESSLPNSTLYFPEILVINGPGNEIEEVVSDDEQPALTEILQDHHRRERANHLRNIRRRHILGNRDPTLPVSLDEVTRDSENDQEVQSHRRRNEVR